MSERLTPSFWLRKQPKNAKPSLELDKLRADVFDDEKELFVDKIDKLKHELRSIDSIEALNDILDKFNVDYRDIVFDVQDFENHLQTNDVASAVSQITSGLDRWASNTIMNAKDDNDMYSLLGHPNKRVMGGGPSLKRSMGY